MRSMSEKRNTPYRRPGKKGWYGTLYDEHGKRHVIKVAKQSDTYETAVVNLQEKRDRIRLIALGLISRRQTEIADKARKPIAEILAEYLAQLKARKRTAKHCGEVQRWLESFFEAQRIRVMDDLTDTRINHFINDILANGRSARTHNAGLGSIRAFCRWAVASSYVAEDPSRFLQRANVRLDKREESRPFTLDEAEQLLTADIPDWRKLYYRFEVRAGLRVSELRDRPNERGLRWSDIDLDSGWIFLRANDTKSRRDDELPMSEDLIEACRVMKPKQIGVDDYIFPNAPTRKTWLRDLMKSGLISLADPSIAERDGKFHTSNLIGYENRWGQLDRKSLRTSFITHRAWAGVDLTTLVKLARHTDPKLTINIYTKAMRMVGRPAGVIDLAGAVNMGLSSATTLRPTSQTRIAN